MPQSKFTLSLFFLALVALQTQAQTTDKGETYYWKSRKALDELCGEKYIPFKTKIFYRKRKINDAALLDSAITISERALVYAIDNKNKRTAELSVTLGDLYSNKQEFPKAQTYYIRAEQEYRDSGSKRKQALASYRLGATYSYMGKVDEAMKLFTDSYDYFRGARDSTYMAKLEFRIGAAHWRLEQPDTAMSHMNRALDLARKIEDTIQIGLIFQGIAMIHGYKGSAIRGIDDQKAMEHHRKATEYYIQAKDLFYEVDNQADLPGTLFNLAVCYKRMENYNTAIDYTKLALQYSETLNNDFMKCRSLLEIAQIRVNQKRYSEAEESAMKGTELAEEIENLRLLKRAYQTLCVVYEAQEDFKKAYEWFDKEMRIERRILNEKSLGELANAEMKYQADKALAERKHTEAELKAKNENLSLTRELNNRANYKVFALTISVVFVLVLLIAALIIYRLKVARLALREKETEVKHLRERQKLESDLESKERDTKDMAHLLAYKNEFTKRMTEEISGIMGEQEPDQLKSHLVELKFKLVRHRKSTNELDIISENFEKVQRAFYEKLKSLCPEISKKELLVSSLIKLDVDTKEMADILGVSDKSIRMYKYRLKKKLELDESTDLNNYIQNL